MEMKKIVPKVIALAEEMMPGVKVSFCLDSNPNLGARFKLEFSDKHSRYVDFRDMMHELMSRAEDFQDSEEGKYNKSASEYFAPNSDVDDDPPLL